MFGEEIEYDAAKDRANFAKHGISLVRAADLRDIEERVDRRREYGEERIIAIGLIDGRVHVCIYTQRGRWKRIISLRPANRREVDAYRSARQDRH